MADINVALYPNGEFDILQCTCCSSFETSLEDKEIHFAKSDQLEPLVQAYLDKAPISLCPYCEKEIRFSYVTDPHLLAENLDISGCDYCEEKGRIVTHLHDEFGFHVLNKCKFGCNDEYSKTDWIRGNLTFQVLQIQRDKVSYMDSHWTVTYQDSTGAVHTRSFTRRDYETAESLTMAIEACTAHHEISRVEQQSRIYYD